MEEEIRELGKIYRNGSNGISAGKAMMMLREIYENPNIKDEYRKSAGRELGCSKIEIILETNPLAGRAIEIALKGMILGGIFFGMYKLCREIF
ncbi:MAG: hypothetical protein N3D20_01110 [Candidatus Pacearchaeota archaeon]|nr:hypothetical protein [Candidatus Pacearchaeota archaeon]